METRERCKKKKKSTEEMETKARGLKKKKKKRSKEMETKGRCKKKYRRDGNEGKR